MAESAGFRFVAASEINANPKDAANWPTGVWTPPPTFTLGDTDREQYAAIVEADNFVLKFQARPGIHYSDHHVLENIIPRWLGNTPTSTSTTAIVGREGDCTIHATQKLAGPSSVNPDVPHALHALPATLIDAGVQTHID